MDKQSLVRDPVYGFLHTEVAGVEALTELALNMRWSWSHVADELWQQLDPELWEQTHNPWLILQTVSRDLLEQQLADPAFSKKVDMLMAEEQRINNSPAWFQQAHPGAKLKCVAYFSMEFMLSEALPIYVGGLGNVAGDQLKAASDLGLPVVAIGLLYQQGYFRQEISKYGDQQALFPYNDPGQLPIVPLRQPNGEWLRLQVNISGYKVWIRCWQVKVGNVKLYLLDTNDAGNLPIHRSITSELYGGGAEMRIKQEIVLGIGGWKLLAALGLEPEVCHLNEGHSAFVTLERAKHFMQQSGQPFDVAMAVTRAGNLFTTHTAVAAGFDHFSPALMEQYFSAYAKEELEISFDELMAFGRISPGDSQEPFNTAFLAIHGSGVVNGVSQLHMTVSQKIFSGLFPRWPWPDIPVGFVTNGVHMPSWDSAFADELWTKACGKDRWRGDMTKLEKGICILPDEAFWQLRNMSRNKLVHFVRQRVVRQFQFSGYDQAVIEGVKLAFNPNILTLGFARRFVPYKRPNLILHNPERLAGILKNEQRPVQLIIAGKAPPFDEAGKALLKEWITFIRQYDLYQQVVFLSDYDVLLIENLVQGVDVWLNSPKYPWEACGTSGMKVLVNGGINLSERDGWWAEAYSPDLGWALGDMNEHNDDKGWNAQEANSFYELLEQQIIPEFYSRDERGIPVDWIKRMRASMSILCPRFSANRAVREYTEKYYLPAAEEFKKRAGDKGLRGANIISKQRAFNSGWSGLKFGELNINYRENIYEFEVAVFMNSFSPQEIKVELYAEAVHNYSREAIIMRAADSVNNDNWRIYKIEIAALRPASDYTPRIIPNYGVAVPLEDEHILWLR